MNDNFILYENSKVKNSTSIGKVTLYRNVNVMDSRLFQDITIGDDTQVINCCIGNKVEINRRNYLLDSNIGDWTYLSINTFVTYAKIGRFCSIGRNVDIGGFNHNYKKVSTFPLYKFKYLEKENKDFIYKDFKDDEKICEVGNDVWIGAGVNILHNVKVGDGAIIGAGSVVTKDVEPYSIWGGVPAKFIKYRFEKHIIDELLKIKWWDWSLEIIEKNIHLLLNEDVNENLLIKLKEISKQINNER